MITNDEDDDDRNTIADDSQAITIILKIGDQYIKRSIRE